MALPEKWSTFLQKFGPRQLQWLTLGAVCALGVSGLWLVFSMTGGGAQKPMAGQPAADSVTVTNIMPPGQQVTPADQWIGIAGKKLDSYEREREEQRKVNADQKAFEEKAQQRFADIEQKLTAAQLAPPAPPTLPPITLPPRSSAQYPPAAALATGQGLPPPPPPPRGSESAEFTAPAPLLVRVSLVPANAMTNAVKGTGRSETVPGEVGESAAKADTTDSFLPVSFARGILLGGLDAPTGGQAQANPQPVLIRLEDSAVLPNRFRGDVKECFVVAAGYGDISSERAYLRTENLSCVRKDGTALEVKIQGSVFGEDGKVGMRGRLVTKEGQLIAKTMLAGFLSAFGSGLAQQSTTLSVNPLGATQSVQPDKVFQYGAYNGVGRAMDRLAQYYIAQLDKIFPVIEIDAGREVDVVITKGVRLALGEGAQDHSPSATSRQDENRAGRNAGNDDYFRRIAHDDY